MGGKVRLSSSSAGVGVGIGAGAGAGAGVNQESDGRRDWHLRFLYPLWHSSSPGPCNLIVTYWLSA